MLHWLIGGRFARPDHALMAVWHLWKYLDVTAGGWVARYPRFFHALDWVDAAAWLWSAWQFNLNAPASVLAGAAFLYAAILYAVWGSGLRGNDTEGSISYAASLLKARKEPMTAKSR